MQRWGKTARGTLRFRCRHCGRSDCRRCCDQRERSEQQWFAHWLLGGLSLAEISRQHHVSLRTLQRHWQPFWNQVPLPLEPHPNVTGVILDATSVMKHYRTVLVVQDARHWPVGWGFAERETYAAWCALLIRLQLAGVYPRYAVCDGQKGLLKALRQIWPKTRIQRCLLHVVRQACLWLTQHPQTAAGQTLLSLVRKLPAVHTKRQRRRWLHAYRRWHHRYELFLKQRTVHPSDTRHWWCTHRKLRAVRSLLDHSLTELFCYTRYPEIPRTTNHVEGGVNSRIKDLYRRHRGLSLDRKTTLTAYYLLSRQTVKKPTRSVY